MRHALEVDEPFWAERRLPCCVGLLLRAWSRRRESAIRSALLTNCVLSRFHAGWADETNRRGLRRTTQPPATALSRQEGDFYAHESHSQNGLRHLRRTISQKTTRVSNSRFAAFLGRKAELLPRKAAAQEAGLNSARGSVRERRCKNRRRAKYNPNLPLDS